ncbi:MAG: zinc-ribbon domain-containing protein [Thermodesulfobacteriota bacterium]
MKIDCPHCGVHGSVDDSLAGKKLRCPKCSKVFLVSDDMRPESDAAVPVTEEVAQALSEESIEPEPAEEGVDEEEPAELEPAEEVVDKEEPAELETEEAFAFESDAETGGEDSGAAEFADEGHVPLEDLLGPEGESKDEFLEKLDKEEACSKCGEMFRSEFLATVGSSRYCTLCLSEEGTDEEDDEDGEEFSEDDFVDDGVPEEKCSVCGESFHPDFLQTVEDKLYCGMCQPDVVEELDDAESSAMALAAAEVADTDVVTVDTDEGEPQKGGSDFTVGDVLKESWQKTKGAKGAVWGGVIVMYAILCGLGFGAFFGLQNQAPGGDPNMAMGINGGLQLVSTVLSSLFTAGIMLIGVRRALEQRVSWSMVFAGFSKFFSITMAMILQTIMILIGFLLLILPGIYLSVGYGLTFPLILEKGLGPWQAMEASRKAIHKKWWTVFGIYLVMMLLWIVSAIPMGLGMIWTVPMFFVLVGVLYVRFFGAGSSVVEDVEGVVEEESSEESE